MMHWLRESFSEELMQALVLRHATGGVWTTESPFDKDFQTAGKVWPWAILLGHCGFVFCIFFFSCEILPSLRKGAPEIRFFSCCAHVLHLFLGAYIFDYLNDTMWEAGC